MPEGKPQLTSSANLLRRRDLDVDDQERERDGKDAIAERLEPRVGVGFCHVVFAVSLLAMLPSGGGVDGFDQQYRYTTRNALARD